MFALASFAATNTWPPWPRRGRQLILPPHLAVRPHVQLEVHPTHPTCQPVTVHMGVSNNNGTPKWMVKITENHINIHRENGGTLGMVPLITNPIYTIYSGYLLGIYGISPFKELLARVKQLGYHPKGTTIFHMKHG